MADEARLMAEARNAVVKEAAQWLDDETLGRAIEASREAVTRAYLAHQAAEKDLELLLAEGEVRLRRGNREERASG